MKALVLEAFNQLEYKDVPDPTLANPDDVLVRVRAVSVCGSDVHGYTGKSGRRTPPMIMGHEAAGEVVAVGPAVANVKPGNRIFITPGISCNTCDACLDGRFDACRNRRYYGHVMPGAYAEYIVIAARAALPIPDNLSFVRASLAEPLSVALKAVSKVHFLPGDTVAVIGGGPIGLMAVALLARYNPERLFIVEPQAYRRELAQAFGASSLIDPAAEDARAVVMAQTAGVGVDHSIEAVGISTTIGTCIEITRPAGTIVTLGTTQRVQEVDIPSIVFGQLRLIGSHGVSREGILRALKLVANGSIPVERLVTFEAPLSEGPGVFARMARDPSMTKVVLIP